MWKGIKGDDKGRKMYRCQCGNSGVIVIKEPELRKAHKGPRGNRIAALCPVCKAKMRVGWPDSRVA